MSRPRNAESVYRAIADPTRRRIIETLDKGDRTVGDLIGSLNLRKNAATFHLGALLACGLVRQQRRGRHMLCSLDTRALHAAHAWLGRYVSRPHARSSLALAR
jgi:DNA-binding transcriptional ArsR family regulator